MDKKNYYEVLGINKEATQEEIKKKYRELCKTHHPDKGGDEDEFKLITEAYNTLSNEIKRQEYNDSLDSKTRNRNGRFYSSFRDFETHIHRQRGDNIVLNVKVSLEEIFTGVSKQYKYKRKSTCSDCNGRGGKEVSVCVTCDGSGHQTVTHKTPIGVFTQSFVCNGCGGSGQSTKDTCTTCNGSGVVGVEETINVDIPRGVSNNMTFVLEGKGNAIKNGDYGDLHINIIELTHEKFTRFNDNLRLNLKLSYSQLVLGDKVDVDTIEGSKIRVTIPASTEVGSVLRINGKGLYSFHSDMRGSMLIHIDIIIPKQISNEEKELIEKLKNLS
jgi:molecular chaperone DnaJ